MASLREAIFQFRGDASDLIGELRKLERKLQELPKDQNVQINADVAKAFADVEALEKKVTELGTHDPDITPHLNTTKVLADIATVRAAIATIPETREVDVRIKRLDVRETKITKQIDQIRARLVQLGELRPEVTVEAKIEQAEARIGQLRARLQDLARKPTSTRVEADTEKAKADIKVLEARINEMRTKNPRVQVDADISTANAKLLALEAQLEAIQKEKREVKIDIDRNTIRQLDRAEAMLRRVTQGVERAGKAAENAARPTLNLSNVMGKLSSGLRRLGPLTTGLAIALFSALLPAIIAVTAAIGGAVAAIGALATAFAATLGPAVALLIPLFLRLQKVIEAFQARSAAMKNAFKDQRAEAEAARRAESQLADARNAVRDANEGVVTAERNLAEARKQARQQIRDARSANTEAAREEKQAAEELARAEVEANEQIKQSIEDVKDARLALKSAELGQEQAKIDTKEARLNLKKLREEMGLAGRQFDATFKKFEDASFDISGSGLKKALQGAGADVSRDPAEMMLKLQQALLDVQKAQLGEKQAADDVSDAHKDLNDKLKESARLQKEGVAGVDSYRAAQERLREATRTHAQTQRELNQLEKDGVKNNPQVVAAREALRDADQQRNDALRRQHDLLLQQKEDADNASGSWQTYQDRLKELDPVEQKMLAAMIGVQAVFNGMKGATDEVFNGIVDAILKVSPFLSGLGDQFKELGQIWGDQIRAFATQFTFPTNLLKFRTIFEGTKSLAQTLGDTFRNVFQALINLAAAAMPYLIQIGEELRNWSVGLADSSADTEKLSGLLAPMIEAFKLFIGIAKELAGVLINTFLAAADPINDFLKWIRNGLKGFNKFLKSTKGKNEVAQFFKDTLPFVKSFITLLINVGKVIITALQILLPIFKPVIDSFNFLLDVLNFILRVVNAILEPFKTLIGIFLSMFIGVSGVGKVLQALTRVFGRFGGGITGVLKAIKEFGGKLGRTLVKPFREAWSDARKLFQTIGGRFGATANRVMDRIEAILKGAWNIITKPFRLAWDGVSKIFAKIREPLAKAATRVWNGIKSVFSGVKGFFQRVFGTIADIGKTMLNGVIRLINRVIRGINKVTPGKIKMPGPIPDIPGLPDIPTIPLLASGGLTKGKTLAELGEGQFQEAVIPLSKEVLREIGRAIVDAMGGGLPNRRISAAGVGTIQAGPKQVFEKVEVNMTSPGGRMQDPRAAAVAFAREMDRRGG